MKIRNYLTILFAALAIIVLLGLAGFMTYYTADDSHPFRQQVQRLLNLDEKVPASVSSPEAATEQGGETPAAVTEHSFLFVGDSRTLGMKDAVADGCTYLGAEGEGFNWFSTDGILALADYLGTDPKQTVILNLGVNDPENVNVYIDLYRELITDYTSASFYILSVNPLDDGKDFNTTNEMIELFNATMESAFPNEYLDCYSYLTEKGYETVDGLHYTDETYQNIHHFVVDKLA